MAALHGCGEAVVAALAVVALLLMTSPAGVVTSTPEPTTSGTTSTTKRTGVVTSTTEPTANGTTPTANLTDSTHSIVLEPCNTTADCLEGLDCTDSLCACPEGCDYDDQEIACRCGSAWTEWGTYAPLIYGLPVNIIIWCVCFKCTKMAMTKHNRPLPLQPASRVVGPTGGVFVVSGAHNEAGHPDMMSPSEAEGPQRRLVNKT